MEYANLVIGLVSLVFIFINYKNSKKQTIYDFKVENVSKVNCTVRNHCIELKLRVRLTNMGNNVLKINRVILFASRIIGDNCIIDEYKCSNNFFLLPNIINDKTIPIFFRDDDVQIFSDSHIKHYKLLFYSDFKNYEYVFFIENLFCEKLY